MNTKENYTYNQFSKKMVRHKAIMHAVETLTFKREKACCVERNYVRKIYDYYNLSEDISKNNVEVQKIDVSYIANWEKLHDSYVGSKRPEDLVVCYLSGPEPDNDFHEFIGMGVLPQNIWGFETNNSAYKKAVSTYDKGEFPQPRILKQNIETFFQQTPKKFDIIYIDSCGSVPSSQHALRCISTICQYHRLNSPGVIISNFAEPDIKLESISGYIEVISQYLFFKRYSSLEIKFDESGISNLEYIEFKQNVIKDFSYYYGEFISAILRDLPSIIIPIQRIARNPYIKQIFDTDKIIDIDNEALLQLSKGHSIAGYFFSLQVLLQRGLLGEKSKCLIKEIGDDDSLMLGLKIIILLKQGRLELKDDVKSIRDYFESKNNLYQFLDKPHSNMLFDVVINQLAYPLHYNIFQNRRYSYVAKATHMYTDINIYDESRYIYEWIPGLHQIISAFENVSWQYIFRFALDGLVKMRQNYNNEFFFQGAVIPNTIKGFESKETLVREIIY